MPKHPSAGFIWAFTGPGTGPPALRAYARAKALRRSPSGPKAGPHTSKDAFGIGRPLEEKGGPDMEDKENEGWKRLHGTECRTSN